MVEQLSYAKLVVLLVNVESADPLNFEEVGVALKSGVGVHNSVPGAKVIPTCARDHGAGQGDWRCDRGRGLEHSCSFSDRLENPQVAKDVVRGPVSCVCPRAGGVFRDIYRDGFDSREQLSGGVMVGP